MGRIEDEFRSKRGDGRKLLVPYITGGYPGWEDAVRACAANGADAIEIGIPFSDPVMDGPVIQQASQAALEAGITPAAVLDAVPALDVDVPLAVMTYYNLVHHPGPERFASQLERAGISGAILPDLPLEESGPWCEAADAHGIETIMLAAPTAPDDRLPKVADRARGFLYSVGLLGVTGERASLAETATDLAERLKAITDRPVLVGVGVSNAEQAYQASRVADGVIQGASMVRRLMESGPDAVGEYVAEVRSAIDAVSSERYDVVIVGGGSAGCALANRLSADPSNRVLVVEAGRRDWKWDVFIHMPAALAFPIGSRFYDWKYESEPEPYMNGRRVYHARGKVLGGSSSINGMIFQRGNPMDYDKWGAIPGLERWDWAHCLPYFKRMETCLAGEDEWRGGAGPLMLERGPASSPLFDAWLRAGEEAGFNRTDDVNGFRQEGFAAFDKNVHRARRLSAARAYLHPVLSRPNLELRTSTHVNRVLFDGNRAIGIEVRKGRSGVERIDAADVILCGGAFNSPQLLQLSGVGDPDHLASLGIDVVADVPGVGENLQDHLEVYIQYESKQPVSIQPHLAHWKKPWIGLQWLFRSGPGASNHFEAGAFVKSNPDESYPNLMFHFLPIAIRYDGSSPRRPDGSNAKIEHGYQVHVGPMYSDARGTVKITSTDPRRHPAVRFNYLSTEQDRREWIEAVRTARHILTQPAFDELNAGEISPGPAVETDQEIMDWVARDSETALHPSCTTKIGIDHMAVLEPDSMKVHRTEGLRVVDAGCMPNVSNGNTYAPTMMIAEKAADLILGNTPLPPDHTEVYRGEPTSGGRR